MASEMNFFSIYKVQNEETYFLIRTERPSFSNASQTQEDIADKIEMNKRAYILDALAKNYNPNFTKNDLTLIGEDNGFPIGDDLYKEHGQAEMSIYYSKTQFWPPSIVLGNTQSESEFLREINEDEDLNYLQPFSIPNHITATFVTENDFDLSSIEHYDVKDVRAL